MEDLEFVVLSGSKSRRNCPISTIIKTKENYAGSVWLTNEETGLAYPGYAHRIDEDHIEVTVLLDQITRESELELTLSEDQPEISPEGFRKPMQLTQKDENTIEIKKNGKSFTNLHYNDAVRPYLMPLIGPFGSPVTREYPLKNIKDGSTDHIHHRSLWSAWGDVNGEDNWSENINAVPQKVSEILVKEAGMALTHLKFRVQWLDNKREPNLDEIREIFIYNTGSNETILDVRNHFTAAYGDVKFGDTKEAGIIAIRVADSLRGSHGGIIENNFGGKMEPECWGKKAFWCDYSGMLGGHHVGITIMDHPDNPGFPSRWHVRNYGLMAANPWSVADFLGDKALNGTFILKKNQQMEFKYRVYIHAGAPADSFVEEIYQNFVNPPEFKFLDF